MLRNQDRPELLLFVGAASARWSDGDGERPGAVRLVAEAAAAGTPSAWLVEGSGGGAEALAGLEPTPWPDAPPLPHPLALQLAREALEMQPDAYGGSDGFGRGRAMPRRPALGARCVVIAATRDACVAGRLAGYRVVGLWGDAEEDLDDASDVSFFELEDDDETVTFDDLYTPGSYWVNPPTPRTVDGLHADPWTGRTVEYGYDANGSARVTDADAAANDDRREWGDSDGLTPQERAILDDLAM